MFKNNAIFGILLMVLATAALASKDGIVKTVLDQVDPVQTLWLQFIGTFAVMALISMPNHGLAAILPTSPVKQFVRGALNVTAISAFFMALKYIPIADATAMLLFAPIVVTIMSPFLLGEKIGPLRIIAAAFGFCGVLTILRPGFSDDLTGYYFGLTAGIFLGLFFIANRRLAGAQHYLLDITHNAMMGALALTPFMFLIWEPVPASLNVKMTLIVALAVIGQGFMISSFKFAPAAVISPYSYTMLIFSALIGYFVFDTLPDAVSWIGMTLIVGSGLYIAYREQRLMKNHK